MASKHSHSPTPLHEGPKQQDSFQEPSNSHQSSSQSSQTSAGAPSSTGHGASGQSMTATTASFDQITYQTALDHQSVATFSSLSFSSYYPIKGSPCAWSRDVSENFLIRVRQISMSSANLQQDLSNMGSWATIEPLNKTFLVKNDGSRLSTNYRLDPVVNSANESAGVVIEIEDTNKEVVELIRASLHRQLYLTATT